MGYEIALKNKETALKIAELLVDEEYCVMLSREENLYIINYEYAQYSNRNEVVFMPRDEFEMKYVEIVNEDEDSLL